MSSIFHEGEVAAQNRAGVTADRRARVEAFIRPFMPEQHREFFESLPVLFLGLIDERGRPWATPVVGTSGFVTTPTAGRMNISATPGLLDDLNLQLETGARVGVIGIELATRRRNRMNGRIAMASPQQFSVEVDHSFGNCPKYIQKRQFDMSAWAAQSPVAARVANDNPEVLRIVREADTFFIASRSADIADGPGAGIDVSHRGGKPGFLRPRADGTLSFPDFAGNLFFNTLGNIEMDGRVGLFIPDFASGDAIYVTGAAKVDWSAKQAASFEGAERIVNVTPDEIWIARGVMPKAGALIEIAPDLERTGSWQEPLEAAGRLENYEPFEISAKVRESDTITSFDLKPAQGGKPAPHRPGQFVPIRITDGDERILRSYTISRAPDGQSYRLSVKREPGGRGSPLLHDRFDVGDVIEAGTPSGTFVLRDGSRPVVMLSAGVGITPMVAMLEGQLQAVRQGSTPREIWFIHSARNGREFAFGSWLQRIAQENTWLRLFISFTAPNAEDRLGQSHDRETRLDAELLRDLLPFGVYDFYICGPGGFIRTLQSGLVKLGVETAQVHTEFFGPGSGSELSEVELQLPEKVEITFKRSDRTMIWTPEQGTLLQAALAAGCKPEFSCGSGSCGTCAVRKLDGEIQYRATPEASVPPGHVLLCSAYPQSKRPLSLDV
ncbi:pyridoxamine 5'-phosphate oxidase family protein [Roseibium sp.]|uniref:2Fe-2S iron-sulfur cluster-binding protein n=1 Tax=Roseibium sp. TaxID=1936156 RepID=UPI003A96B1B7